MKKWGEVLTLSGTFISEEIDVSSNYKNYITEILTTYDKPSNTDIKCELRFKLNENDWGDWYDIQYFSQTIPNIESTTTLKAQYKITLRSKDGVNSPSFSSIRMNASGSYEIVNVGDLPCKPEVWIKKLNSKGDIRLTNTTNNKTVILTDIYPDETVYLNGENENIITDRELTYRYDNHNGVFLELDVGSNIIIGEGDFEFDIKAQYKLLQG